MQVGEIISVYPEEHHYVYALLGDDGMVFYIGVTQRPMLRLYQHSHERTSTSRVLFEKLKSVKEPRLLILSIHLDREEALLEERQQISSRVDLLNQEHRNFGRKTPGAYQRLPVFEQFRKKSLDRVPGDPVG